ncbi:MAG: signal peptidase II [Actinobacteria bacterium]|nr:signal peptidase II [Actinomycetota bacterium]
MLASVKGRTRLGWWLYAMAVLEYGLDRATKVWVESSLAGRPPIEVIPGVFRLRFITNPGGAFGLFGGVPALFLVATLLAVVAIVVAGRSVSLRSVAVGLGLILGGALGNLTDRVIRGSDGLSGSVVDFLDFGVWPVFNVADMGIVIGAGLVVLASARTRRETAEDAAGPPDLQPEPPDER